MIQKEIPNNFLLNRYTPSISLVKSWHRVSPELDLHTPGPGCAADCKYCNQHFFNREKGTPDSARSAPYVYPGVEPGLSINTRMLIGATRVFEVEPHIVVQELSECLYYNPDVTILLENFNDSAVDFQRTFKVATLLVEQGHQGALVFYTKLGFSQAQIRQLEELKKSGGKPVIMISYSGLPEAIEPIGSGKRLKTAQLVSEAQLPLIWSLRPLINGINCDEATIRQVLSEMAQYATAVAMGGLYVEPITIEAFKNAGYPLASEYTNHDFPVVKVIEDEITRLIKKIAAEMGVIAPMYDHTACATAYVTTCFYNTPTANRKAHWMDEWPTCVEVCPACQQNVCKAQRKKSLEKVIDNAQRTLTDLGYQNLEIIPSRHSPHKLRIIGGLLLWEELCLITERCGWRIDNLPDKEGLLFRIQQALSEDLGHMDPDGIIRDAVLIGEDWYVIVDNIVTNNGRSVVMSFRSRAQARVQVLTFPELKALGPIAILDKIKPEHLSHDERLKAKNALEKVIKQFS